MPKVTYSPKKGLVISDGSGFYVEGAPIKGPEETVSTLKGGIYTGTAVAAAASALVGKYMIFHDRDGTPYAIWWDTAGGGTEPAAIDAAGVAAGQTLEITGVGGSANANTVASTTTSEMNASAKLNTKFEVVNASANNFAIHVLECGEMSNATITEDAGFSMTVADGAGAIGTGNSQISLASAGDVTGVAAEVPLADGTVIGQRCTIHQAAAPSNGTCLLTGNFSDSGTHTYSKATFAKSDNDHYCTLIWTGLDWADITNDGVTYS